MTTYEPADWEPGDIALIEAHGTEPQHRLLYVTTADNYRWHGADGFVSDVISARRLKVVDPASVVTLDPNNPDDVEKFRRAALDYYSDNRADEVAVPAALRSLLPTPPLPEPNGLGAVVRGVIVLGEGMPSDEVKWVRAIEDGGPAKWALATPALRSGYERWWLWSAMRVVEVVSHGVGCTCGGPGCPGVDA